MVGEFSSQAIELFRGWIFANLRREKLRIFFEFVFDLFEDPNYNAAMVVDRLSILNGCTAGHESDKESFQCRMVAEIQ